MKVGIRFDKYATGGPCFVATDEDIPGAVGYGDTVTEALAALNHARVLITGDPNLPMLMEWILADAV